jgi:dTDP-4-dehydrorhamnose reductase
VNNLIIGGSGLLGKYLKLILPTYTAPNHNELDLESNYSIRSYFNNNNPNNIYIAAALTNVDECEKDENKSFTINCKSVQLINELSPNSKIIYYSSDYVFDGTIGRYCTSDMPNPINIYGRHKLCTENYLLTNAKDPLIIRTGWLFGYDDKQLNFPMQVINKLRGGEFIKVNPIHYGTPTYAGDLAKESVILSTAASRGIFHIVSSNNLISKYDFAIQVCNLFNLDSDLIFKENYKTFAKRPLKAGLFYENGNFRKSMEQFKNDTDLC